WLSRESLRALGDPLWREQEWIAAGAILPLISGDEVYGALTYFSRQEVPDELLETLANFAALTTASLHRIDRLRAEQDARAAAETAERHMRFLVGAGAALGSSLDSSETLQQLVQLAVPALGTESAIDVLDAARDRTRRIASAPPATGGEPAQLALDHLPEPARIITSSMSQLLSKSDLAEQASRLADSRIGSCLRVPLRFRGKSFAALTVVRLEGEESYTTADLRVAEDLAERAALALEKAWLFEEQVSAINRIQQLATEQRLVLSQIADGVVITDESGLITFANAAAHQIHGEVKLGRTIQEHARAHELRTPSGEPVPEHELILADALNARTSTYNVERRLCRDDGAEVTVLVSAAPLLNDQGLPRGAVVTLRAVTEIRELARQKDDFVIGASHDLKSPLTGIKGWAQLLLQRADKSEHLAHERAGLNAILGQAEAMQTLLERMLEAIRLQSTSLQASRLEVIDLCELAEQVVTMHLAATTMHDLRLNGAAAGDIIGKWDRGQIGQILDNLVGNAIKYSPKGGQVDVVLARDAEHAYVEVRDSGIGIPEEARPRVFNQFYRAPNTALDPAGARPDGLGLGLFSAQQLARRHGGRIDVQSRDGAGSVFRVTLPLSPVRAANEHESQPPKDEHASAE
ncbi:MAG: ATP-binding protein, partial [Thermomicrobiales bacterium]